MSGALDSPVPPPVLAAAQARRSYSKVTDDAPTTAELERLLAAAGRVADHSALHPWRLIALRGEARVRLGRALAAAAGASGSAAASLEAKPLRAPLLIAVVFSPQPSHKVAEWEQEAVASGVAHLMSLLLHEAGWGVMWRTGPQTRAKKVATMHGLAPTEKLLGWLYVGGVPERAGSSHDKATPLKHRLSTLEG
ncbi:nitroreductase family protein [Microterricola viridarii]|uniref:Putative NAD(P)H nitroreductase n=1 Tax=Microterricola viridarii TaxID=412690 RepID=A0A0X8E4K6_9MICO|nr:nitroreductase family protein [Microterricola viridarii]AMB59293.1 nitroreductase [Microterricola viridarii]